MGAIDDPEGIESVTGGLLNGEDITLGALELVDDLRSSSPAHYDRLAAMIGSPKEEGHAVRTLIKRSVATQDRQLLS
jgi:hypothetical protein